MLKQSKSASSGMSLPELMVGLFLMAVTALGAAPLFIHAMHGNAASRDLSWVGVAAEQRFELLRSDAYDNLTPGGSVTGNVTGYFDEPQPGLFVRWEILDNSSSIPRTKIVTVRAVRARTGPGPTGEVTMITMRGR